ncbi:hypothetical protein C9374_009781 [Naegleria lovaniensis]|uniref:Peroxidase n=1 Tax=Naegleria lovaniensis TaxID=51637 RepID=A0AA88KS15_NAELO|nr:uncharacterized protein C9374_009781 [Naegleria lovaniensis]KAG2393204.1 hypothetical protein C9374_009781 [Naegleria lovaniensis]
MKQQQLVVALAAFLLASTAALVLSTPITLRSLRKLSRPIYSNCYGSNYDGVGVNEKHPTWGMTSEPLVRVSKAAYLDGVKEPPRLATSARVISNAFNKQGQCDESNDHDLSAMFYAFGQFVDHDISFEGTGLKFTETLNIEVPPGDVWTTPLPFTRAVFASNKPTFTNEPVGPVNFVTGYMDCSQVYGSDLQRARELREFNGGLLRHQLAHGQEFLPKTRVDPTTGLFYLGAGNNTVIAGDTRATEALPISIMQTLWLREHNRVARLVAQRFGVAHSEELLAQSEVDEWIFQTARSIVCAEIQHITYHEYLPRLLGSQSPNPCEMDYDEDVRVTANVEFSTAAYRFGHSMVGCSIHKFTANGTEVPQLPFDLAFNAYPLLMAGPEEYDMFLRGIIKHHSFNLDEKVVDGLRQVIRGRLDLPARNMQRGRDLGLPDYNTIRKAVGLQPQNATQITDNEELQNKLIQFFGPNLVNLEPWLGILIEKKTNGGDSLLGELGTLLIKDQFAKYVKADKCFYSHNPQRWARAELKWDIERVTLADIIAENTGIPKSDKAMGTSPWTAKYGPLV